jgi:hypothetical protein
MVERQTDFQKAINTTLTPPEEDLKLPDEDLPPVQTPIEVPVRPPGADVGAEAPRTPDEGMQNAPRAPEQPGQGAP